LNEEEQEDICSCCEETLSIWDEADSQGKCDDCQANADQDYREEMGLERSREE
jgi:hypothetical protein